MNDDSEDSDSEIDPKPEKKNSSMKTKKNEDFEDKEHEDEEREDKEHEDFEDKKFLTIRTLLSIDDITGNLPPLRIPTTSIFGGTG